jgi:tubulin polyglutamylase TTLL9
MSEAFRRYIPTKSDLPPAATVKFKCAKLHRALEGAAPVQEFNTIYDVLKSRGWKECQEGEMDWHIYWCEKEWVLCQYDQVHLDVHQRLNHFRNHYELTRKDLLAKNLKRVKRQQDRENKDRDTETNTDILPITFVLPLEYSMFTEEFKKLGGTWIMKPIGKSQGTGIFLMNKLSQVSRWKPQQMDYAVANDFERQRTRQSANAADDKGDDAEKEDKLEAYVVQRYVENPLVIGGKKFDLRLYCLVTSYNPLTIYLHRGGFCRFSMARFSMDKSQFTNMSSHLTNVAVQKHTVKGNNAYQRTGGKWELNGFKNHLIMTVGQEVTNKLFTQIEEIMIASSLAVKNSMINDKHCFELYGFDILVDANYRPWLLEVNASPSLTANTPADYKMKFEMLDDVLTIVDIEKYLTGQEEHIGGFDLIYRGGRISTNPNAVYSSTLGCAASRKDVWRLAKKPRFCSAR